MIENKEFKSSDRIENISWGRFLCYLEGEAMALIVLASLYESNVITREKLKGQLSSLRKGNLLKRKGTYHCEINDRWYSYEPASNVFKDLSERTGSVSYDGLIEVLQLYTGKNYNYCVDYVVGNIIKPTLNRFANSYVSYSYLSELFCTNIEGFPRIEHSGYQSECNCCGGSNFEVDYRGTLMQISKIIDFFHRYKKGNLVKIPRG